MIECTRRIEFDCGHRVIGHKNKCQYLHGHRYVLEITAASDVLNDLGMVIDFCELKNIMKGWIDKNFDHTMILSVEDKALGDFLENHTGQKVYYLDTNPTVENIALHLKLDIIPILFNKNSVTITKIRLFETPNAFVEVK